MVKKTLAKSLGRKQPSLPQEPKILIICEDSKSSLNYLNGAKYHCRIGENVSIEHCGKTDPDGIVSYGVSKKNKFEKVYCVIDRDTHLNFDQAVIRARDNQVSLVTSYPSFEYWLYIHFKYTRKPYVEESGKSPAEMMKRDLILVDQAMADYDKGSSKDYYELLLAKLTTAMQHGSRSLNDAETDGEKNPCTQLHLLIDKFLKNNFL